MSYENKFNLKMVGNPQVQIPVSYCPSCDSTYKHGTKFCNKDGVKLEDGVDTEPAEGIIAEFRDMFDDSAHLIDDDGKCENPSGGNGINDDLKEFSKVYPVILFQLDVTWDNGFSDPPSRYYFKNGLMQDCKTTVTFEEYDESKLK